MEDVLDEYARPYDAAEPSVCFDERPCQLLADQYAPQPAQPGQLARYDYEYVRHGTANVLMMFQPLTGWREAKVTQQRTQTEFAECLRELADVHFPAARLIHIVCDNLNTHSFAALYHTFPPAEALRLMRRFQFHFTPKHASWLNMVEIELGILVRQCLNRRLPDLDTLTSQVRAWQDRRNATHATVQWTFTVEVARLKLVSLYS